MRFLLCNRRFKLFIGIIDVLHGVLVEVAEIDPREHRTASRQDEHSVNEATHYAMMSFTTEPNTVVARSERPRCWKVSLL